MKKVIVAMSGGVDSSVTAALLKEQGFAVEGIFMKNWSPESLQTLTDCPWEQDQADAAAVCEHLGIPFRSINFEKEYKERVVNYFLHEYANGRTPNPDVMCNKEIKFDIFLRAAVEAGADYIATGHYARLEQNPNGPQLARGLDKGKDQSYFLYTLQRDVLCRTILPLGNLEKREVRELASSFSLPTAQKKDSQGICFIGHIDLKRFLQEQLTSSSGSVYLLPQYEKNTPLEIRLKKAEKVGEHRGSIFYTIGERAGELIDNGLYRKLRQGADVPPVYVLEKDFTQNALYITDQHNDPHFISHTLYLENWYSTGGEASTPLPSAVSGLTCQVRYQQKDLAQVQALHEEDGRIRVETSGLYAAAPGQSLVVYNGDQVVGGGIVSQVLK